jgi:UDP-N-acetylglucosamine acyltransferase
MVGGQAHITKDVPPFVTIDGLSSMIVGLNLVGLKRAGFRSDEILQLKAAYRLAFRGASSWNEMLQQLKQEFPVGRAAELHQFLSQTRRGCIAARSAQRRPVLRLHAPTPESSPAAGAVAEARWQRRASA